MRFLQSNRRNLASTMQDHGRAVIDAIVIAVAMVIGWWIIHDLNLFEKLYQLTRTYEYMQIDEIVIIVLLSVIGLVLFGARRLQDQKIEIKRRQRAEDRARHLALADALTGLPNRRQFEARFVSALSRLAGSDDRLALMMIDLDRFKPINDIYGHGVGDQVLIAFSKRASSLIGPGDMLARFGGDEFALLLTASRDREEPARVARRLLALFERPFDVGEAQVSLGASIGIALAPTDGMRSEELMRRADIALYRAKTSGRGSYRFFEAEMDTQVKERGEIERDLRAAIEQGTVRPYYQPIIDLRTGAITGFEALARWQHPKFGDLEPEKFIAIAEDSGLIIPLSSHLLRCAAADATNWPSHVKLCFNISRVQLADPMLVLRVLQILGDTGLSPTRLEIEISEQALVSEIIAAREALENFHRAGVRIALDDFGTGNSSLRHLRECHFDRLKIDRSFVTAMIGSNEATSLVNAVLGLSKALGLPVTAEGIESEAVIEALRLGGCTEGQGFNFSKAVSAESALELLAGNQGAERLAG